PSHQFPTGIVMPIARRRALLNWAEESRDRYIIESDYDSEFRFSGNPIPACQGLDTSGKVIYLNTFTKTLAPSLRISYLVLPPDLLAVYQEKFKDYSCTVPNFEQYILSEFIKGGYFERHLHRMSKIYRQKRDTLIDLIKNSPLKDKIEFLGSNAGLHLLLQVDLGLSEKELIALAAENSVRVYGLSEYYYDKSLGDRYDKHIIIGYSGLSLEDIQAGGQLLTEAWLKGK
ncbi:MAG: PLP-dependent aminotransferase family protein, partial [Clostridiales bacterium]